MLDGQLVCRSPALCAAAHSWQPLPGTSAALLIHRYERYDWFPYNNGVMLWNVPYMKRTNADFIKWILNQHNGLYYGRKFGRWRLQASRALWDVLLIWPHWRVGCCCAGYTAVDQGAFNQYYEHAVKGKPISRVRIHR